MHFGIHTPNFGPYADPHTLVSLARTAEEAGWDGFFLWDHVLWNLPENQPAADPWILMSAMAAATERIRIGTLVTPIPRRRPHKLARETVTLDHLSRGRLTLGVGIGGDWFGDYSAFGETTDQKAHGEMLDEGLQVLTALWSGEPVNIAGKHFQAKETFFKPTPVQQPRIPIWVAGMWPGTKPFRRAAQWDGVFALRNDDQDMEPDDHRALLDYIRRHRTEDAPFDVVHGGRTTGTDPQKDTEQVSRYADAGVTWWLESFWPELPLEEVQARIKLGPTLL